MFALFRILVFIKSSPDYQGISVEIEACFFGFPVKIGAVMSQDCSQLKIVFLANLICVKILVSLIHHNIVISAMNGLFMLLT